MRQAFSMTLLRLFERDSWISQKFHHIKSHLTALLIAS